MSKNSFLIKCLLASSVFLGAGSSVYAAVSNFIANVPNTCKSTTNPGSVGYEVRNLDNKKYRVTVRTNWSGGYPYGTGWYNTDFVVNAGGSTFIGCSISGYPHSTSYSFSIVNQVRLP